MEKENPKEKEVKIAETKKLLNLTLIDLVAQIDKNFQAGFIAVRKKKSDEKIWELWGWFMLQLKMELEILLMKTPIPVFGWLYAYLQNRNQLMNAYMETRVGKAGMKKSLKKSGKILTSLIFGKASAGPKDEVNKKVNEHLDQLYVARKCDIIAGRQIYVSDYPQEERIPEEPYRSPAPGDPTN